MNKRWFKIYDASGVEHTWYVGTFIGMMWYSIKEAIKEVMKGEPNYD